MSLSEFLVWVVGGGGVLASSWLLERVAWYQALQPDKKQLVFYAVCLLFSLGAFAVQTYVPPQVLEQLNPVFLIISSTFGSIFLGSVFHKNTKLDSGQG